MTPLAAVLIGHLLGDFVVQTDEQAARKTYHWGAMLGHVATYHLVLALALIPVWDTVPALTTLAVSATTHAAIDRRWPVRALLRATGSRSFADTTWGVLAVDQALHLSILAGCTALWAVA